MEADDDEDLPLEAPPAQPLLKGDELQKRMDTVIGDAALWNRLEIRLGDLLEEIADLDESLNDDELQAIFTVTIIALGAMHPTVSRDYDPDAFRMSEWYEQKMADRKPGEEMEDRLEGIFVETAQEQVAATAADMLESMAKEKGSQIRKKRLEQLITAVCAAIWEAAHWPVEIA
ncbi:hypothetical protein [Haloferula sp. BvORR071]|uniref:hypothetical protein n=1 Tax=Haloferula sp. BvORR071 TaxID=1396141 RepID=UPI0005560D36|nr:hypothetical protein [Haloferula sp. BvORR071]